MIKTVKGFSFNFACDYLENILGENFFDEIKCTAHYIIFKKENKMVARYREEYERLEYVC